MKNVPSIKSNAKIESPKTPGGISKSLLTPCRRVGLSRNWKNKGPSPFISPLASNTSNKVEPVVQKKETRKRKSVIEPDEKSTEIFDSETEAGEISTPPNNSEDIVKTPLRNVDLPRRKKSKTFLATLNSQRKSNISDSKLTDSPQINDCTTENEVSGGLVDIETPSTQKVDEIINDASPQPEPAKPEQKNKKFQTPLKSAKNTTLASQNDISATENGKETPKDVAKLKKKKSESKPSKTRSPNELTKECIVVIQKKLLNVKEKYDKCDEDDKHKKNSQPLFDSDDEAPLSALNKKECNKAEKAVTIIDDDEDEFVVSSSKNKNKKTECKSISKTDSKVTKPVKPQASKIVPLQESKLPSQSSFDEDDDDFFDKKKTILIRKTYDKIVKLSKAKSTGSVTQKDIDDLKARIEIKKKMLLARSMTSETEELRSLIKKWQKGCQEALVELMDLMKIKCPDKHGMDYSEILQMLKIPPALVGYDSDHDCFNTPDDTSAILSKYNDF